ncbi:hypothetical protein P7K49_033907, partial [Saguinus oedipus]
MVEATLGSRQGLEEQPWFVNHCKISPTSREDGLNQCMSASRSLIKLTNLQARQDHIKSDEQGMGASQRRPLSCLPGHAPGGVFQ